MLAVFLCMKIKYPKIWTKIEESLSIAAFKFYKNDEFEGFILVNLFFGFLIFLESDIVKSVFIFAN
jgi:hypothetical protein